MTREIRSARNDEWPKRPGHYWIRLGSDEFAQPCFYDPSTRMVLLCGQQPQQADLIGWAIISDKPMQRTTIIPRRKRKEMQ